MYHTHFPITFSDIGGYTGYTRKLTRTKELLLRWAEYAVFTPVMRTHEGNLPGEHHQIYSDKDTLKQFARLTNMYAALYELRVDAINQNHKNGNGQFCVNFNYYDIQEYYLTFCNTC